MKTRTRNLFVTFCFIVLITACSNRPTIQSATPDKVIIKAPPENFLDAYEMAKKKCEEHNKYASYIPDETSDIEILAFDCVGEEVEEVVTESEEVTAETEETPIQAESIPTETEETPAEIEEVTPQEN